MDLPLPALLHWAPEEAFASAEGDFGASWGRWEMHPDGDRTTPPAARGTYLTVWRRDAAGAWKGLMDIGTADPGYRPPQTLPDPAGTQGESPDTAEHD